MSTVDNSRWIVLQLFTSGLSVPDCVVHFLKHEASFFVGLAELIFDVQEDGDLCLRLLKILFQNRLLCLELAGVGQRLQQFLFCQFPFGKLSAKLTQRLCTDDAAKSIDTGV